MKRRTLTTQSFSKRQLDEALERLSQRSDAFQSTTVIRPLSQIAEALEHIVQTSDYSESLDVVLDFIDESLSRFLQRPYSFFDEAASLNRQDRNRNTFSCVLVSFGRQWQYTVDKEKDPEKVYLITEFFFDLLFRASIIAESPDALVALLGTLKTNSTVDGKSRIENMRQRILGWMSSNVSEELKSNTVTGIEYHSFYTRAYNDRKWSKLQNKPLSDIAIRLRTHDLIAHSNALVSEAKSKVNQLTPYVLILFFLRLVRLPSYSGLPEAVDTASCFNLLLELVELQRDHARQRFQETKLALGQLFCSYISSAENAHKMSLERCTLIMLS